MGMGDFIYPQLKYCIAFLCILKINEYVCL
nr:MAG TPA: hypothetical protein [Caudoviricetes sp.]DAH08302.1 MAG TPA: hypothetical protein [Caudoviricetes sp.]